jgi:hypothetical protein
MFQHIMYSRGTGGSSAVEPQAAPTSEVLACNAAWDRRVFGSILLLLHLLLIGSLRIGCGWRGRKRLLMP